MTTWILLRGLMREARHWGGFAQQLQTELGATRVITPDFPGNGSLFEAESCASVPQMADYLRQHLQAQGIAPPYRVLALSLGAMVALDWATRFPQEVEKLVLLNTSVAPHNRFYHRLRPRNYLRLLGLWLRHTPLAQERLILRLTSNVQSERQRQQLLQTWLEYAQACPVSRANIARQLLAAMRFRAPLAAPGVPLLMLAAQQDRLVNVWCSQKLARMWGVDLRLHRWAGHDLPLDDAGWVLRQVRAWL